MAPSEKVVLEALRKVPYPGFRRDILSFGLVHDLRIEEGVVSFRLDTRRVSPEVADGIRSAAVAAVLSVPGVVRVDAVPRDEVLPPPPEQSEGGGEPNLGLLPDVAAILAVASGKGGVGKSTVAVNLAVALARRGARIGLLDADVYGPSIPFMMGIRKRPSLDESGSRILPLERYGVRLMSLGFFIEPDSALIWRGPMVMKALEQLLRDVVWGPLDALVVDLPPGTGDAQLTLSQKVRLTGAVIVTTPQDVALADAIRGVAMFRKVGVPVLGIVENMSYFACPHCRERSEIFGHGGGKAQSEKLGVPFLGEVPLDVSIRIGGDEGTPIVVSEPDSPQTAAFLDIAARLCHRIGIPTPPTGPG